MARSLRRSGIAVVILAASSVFATEAAAQVDGQVTACGVAPLGYNVIESDGALIEGTPGDDFICAGDSSNRILGLAGNDVIFAGGGDDFVSGGDGDDVIDAGTESDTVHGDDGRDHIDGGRHPDTLFGGPGADTIFGGGGKDRIRGDRGADIIDGEQGRDKIWGGAGSDTIRGGRTGDAIRGNQGDDVIAGDHGRDRVFAGPGHDRCSGDREVDCEDIIRDLGIKTVDRDTVRIAHRAEDRTQNTDFFTENATATIYLWDSPEMEELLWSAQVPTDRFGRFGYSSLTPFPVGSFLEVSDDASGQHVGLDITLDVSHFGGPPDTIGGVTSIQAYITLNAEPNTAFSEMSSPIRPLSNSIAHHLAYMTDENGFYEGILRVFRTDETRTVITVKRSDSILETYDLSNDRPNLWISQYAVGAEAGPWTPFGLIEVTRDGQLVTSSVQADYRGRFGFGFDTPLGAGSTITVRDLSNGHLETVEYDAEFEIVRANADVAFAEGSLWAGHGVTDDFLAPAQLLDHRGKSHYSDWRYRADHDDWTFHYSDYRRIYGLSIWDINEDNQEIRFFF